MEGGCRGDTNRTEEKTKQNKSIRSGDLSGSNWWVLSSGLPKIKFRLFVTLFKDCIPGKKRLDSQNLGHIPSPWPAKVEYLDISSYQDSIQCLWWLVPQSKMSVLSAKEWVMNVGRWKQKMSIAHRLLACM